jgi:beta-N-acetylhexosaminidase
VVADSHLALPVDRRPIEDMTEDMAPYRRLISNGLPAVMVAHVLFSSVDDVPASVSSRWIRGVLRGDLRFQGAVFSDDLSMAGAAAAGDIVTRAERALAAGCDVLPVCNNPASVVTLLDQLKVGPEPASQLRVVRMRGREGPSREVLMASDEWRIGQEALARSAAAPALNLESGKA